ncbi:MAG TPA: MliC family protein [Caulobacteraceae bacterium]|jgi:membrane-bound inhibitor of C-type lysozyme|nr:MliC family protein [Caulobacteraceae bacterium]
MRTLLLIGAALAAGLVTAPAMAATARLPPMNNFNIAFYNCDDNAAFLMSYDSNRATAATMTISSNNKQYKLKKAPVATGVQFSDGAVKFWTDGDKVTVDGTEIPLTNCKLKP